MPQGQAGREKRNITTTNAHPFPSILFMMKLIAKKYEILDLLTGKEGSSLYLMTFLREYIVVLRLPVLVDSYHLYTWVMTIRALILSLLPLTSIQNSVRLETIKT
jgi:hypothetical protein